MHRGVLAEVPREPDRVHARVALVQPLQRVEGVIRRSVVDEEQLERAPVHRRDGSLVQLVDRPLLVEHGHDDRKGRAYPGHLQPHPRLGRDAPRRRRRRYAACTAAACAGVPRIASSRTTASLTASGWEDWRPDPSWALDSPRDWRGSLLRRPRFEPDLAKDEGRHEHRGRPRVGGRCNAEHDPKAVAAAQRIEDDLRSASSTASRDDRRGTRADTSATSASHGMKEDLVVARIDFVHRPRTRRP